MRRPHSLIALAVAAICVAAAVHSYVWYAYLPAFNTPHTALEGATPPRTLRKPERALTRRLVVMVVDGLGWPEARSLPALAELRRLGHGRMLNVEFPSYTYPAITSLVTGVEPSDSGVRLNGDWEGATGLEAVPGLVARANGRVSLRTRGWKPFEELMRPAPGAPILRGRAERMAALATERVLDGQEPASRWWPIGDRATADLILEYLDEIDTTAHEVGTDAPAYRAAVEHVSAVIAERLAHLDLAQDSLVVVSDHAHRRAGGHGGVEPEVLQAAFFAAGPTLRRGVELPARPMRDVASTLALMAGVAVPASNLGRPMIDGLSVGDGQRARLLAAGLSQQLAWRDPC